MKHVVSVSLGSPTRDQDAVLTLMGESVKISRRGTDGDLERARELIADLDGKVDAIGLGGIDRFLIVRGHRYEIHDALRLVQAARLTPVVDGSGVKDTIERRIIEDLQNDGIIQPGQSVLMVSSMDRFGMAETFERLGYALVAGDLIFSSRINYPIRSVTELEELARKLLPELSRLPFNQLYPVGAMQREQSDPRFVRYFDEADIIAGDFHYIRRYWPDNLCGKLIITNTTTVDDLKAMRERGVGYLVTTTPIIDGRSFGTNVIEAALVAVTGMQQGDPGWVESVLSTHLSGSRLDLSDGIGESET